ncbi:MAG: aminotransferase class I/II-fold pyridoxal phosphate-dependent enzyme [Planctomycetales bacterium]|nr:aminotransferase class I/II-fold pyridoxal phosphate-dependent enzyme [Planctomycetales bacterium]NIM07794.1 aminotransferase class I/II-fold pyridoxal phosphate-dependent enzyme [Planctomycetales bacterium]NIN07285.1 aminotransferase class I/II-fold pyridoxal phosphate-dependent enzyme [Planctomycetales bacterium]NIN76380.1 aminotransferase class I/II-fold pyridoxal phosphate-dependent enzyme [Planctomycetales bacterium]NIO33585.1 aminotransferase class I/II-fold pyridoxal phosphate-depende
MAKAARVSAPDHGVPLLDINRQLAPLLEEIEAAVARVFRNGSFVLGPDVEQLETSMASYCGTRHAIGCASGSDALLLALMAAGIEPGDEVILPSYTFFATASAVARLGARIVFADIDPATFNVDPEDVERRITAATKAIIPVHLYGQCAEMEPLRQMANQHGLWLVEDAAQAIGAEYREQPAGSLGDVGCFSFYPTKNLGGAGDGGMLTTNDDQLADRLRLLRVHGMRPRYYHPAIGINSRLDSLQAAVLNVKFPHLEHWTDLRQQNAARYVTLFTAAGLDRHLVLPTTQPAHRHVWNQFVVRVPAAERDALRRYLASWKIGTEIYYPVPLHLQECYRHLDIPVGSLPHTEKAATESLALPIFPELRADEQQWVVDRVAEFRQSTGCKQVA